MNKEERKRSTIIGENEQTKENKGKRRGTLATIGENEQRREKSNNNC